LLVAATISMQGVIADTMLSYPAPSNVIYADCVLHLALFTNFLISFTSISVCMTSHRIIIYFLCIFCGGCVLAVSCMWINVVWWTVYSLIVGSIADTTLVPYTRLLLSTLVSGMVSVALLIYFQNRSFLTCCCCLLQPRRSAEQGR
jgi:hypothetical protein